MSDRELDISILPFSQSRTTSWNYSEENYSTIVNWLEVQNLEIFRALQQNRRIIMEGGPGTGKTTIAKAFIRKYKKLRGVYLCWNNLLASQIKFDLERANIRNCQVEQYISFLSKLSTDSTSIGYEDFQSSPASIRTKISEVLKAYMRRNNFYPYDFIVIDEAQDIFDKGVKSVINALTSINSQGLSDGRYLVFYDTEQGYRADDRQLRTFANELCEYGTHYLLNENKRVPSNKSLVQCANKILHSEPYEIDAILTDSSATERMCLKLHTNISWRECIRHLKTLHRNAESTKSTKDYTILSSASLKRGPDSFYDRLADIEWIKELTPGNLPVESGAFPLTTILSYKGLENKHIIMALDADATRDKYELYVGISRAILDVEILFIKK